MTDLYLEGAEVHAETPEEEWDAALLLNGALSGKKTREGVCICPNQRNSALGKGFILRLSEGTTLHVAPTLDVEGTPELDICCCASTTDQEAPKRLDYLITLDPKPRLRDYIVAMYQFNNELTDYELVQLGHDRELGRLRLVQALETVDTLADYDEEAAAEDFENFMEANFPNVTFKPAFANPRVAR